MHKIKERLVVVFNDDGSFKGASLDERTILEDGRTLNEQRPLDEDDADALIGKVDAEVVAQLESVIAERDSLLGEIETLKSQVPAPIGARQITPEDFLTRFSPDDIVAIDQSKDPRVVVAKVTLQTRSSLIDLDSQVLSDLLDGLVAGGVEIDDDERARLLA